MKQYVVYKHGPGPINEDDQLRIRGHEPFLKILSVSKYSMLIEFDPDYDWLLRALKADPVLRFGENLTYTLSSKSA